MPSKPELILKAAQEAAPDALLKLVNQGINLNAYDIRGDTALSLAVVKGERLVIEKIFIVYFTNMQIYSLYYKHKV